MGPWGALVIVVLLAGCSVSATPATHSASSASSTPSSEPSASSFEIRGTLELHGRVDFMGTGTRDVLIDASGNCQGEGGYNDIQAGAQVVVSDAAGTTLALGRLDAGMYDVNATGVDIPCMFAFTVADVPFGQQFYQVEVAHRGKQQYTADQVAGPVTLSLGTGS